ncbi:MAG: DNA internalization-related competence protein ComEC/Rec2 [Lachnospiraceae bacterium]|nr:DNA internalization-related competence protein ComEC/Rec2 [Lachnospiraceae bacterium]
MIRRPFTVVFCALCLGIICRAFCAVLTPVIVALYAALLLAFRLDKKFALVFKRCELTLCAPFLFFLGMILAENAGTDHRIDLSLAQTSNGKLTGVAKGVVESLSASSSGFKLRLGNAAVEAEGLVFTDGAVLVYLDDVKDLAIGNTVRIKGTLREFSRGENPGQFDEFEYYRSDGYSCKMYATSVEVLEGKKRLVKDFLRRLKERLAGVFDRLLPEKEAGLVKALVLGDKSTLDPDVRTLFRQNGIVHILAISGLHISLVGSGLFMLLRGLKAPLIPASAISFFFCFCYGMLTGFPVSAVRAVFMFGFNMAAKALGRSYESGEACAMCGVLLLLKDPLLLFQSAFVLSFSAAVGIGYFTREFSKWEKSGGKGGALLGMVLSTLAPQLSTVPFIWFYYYEIPVYGMLANLIVLPGMSLLVVLAALSGVLGLFFIAPARFLAGGVYYLLKAYEGLCGLLLKLPHPVFLYGKPERIRMVLCYGLMVLFFVVAGLIGKRYGNGEASRKKRPLAAFVLLLIPLVFVKLPKKSLDITFLSVGQGDSCVMQTDNGTAVMVDCGSSSAERISEYRLEPFLKYSGIHTIEAIFLTHPDKDHFSGILELLERAGNDGDYCGTVRVKRLIVTPGAFQSPKLKELLLEARAKGVEILTFLAGDSLKAGELELLCLAPEPAFDTADNDGSIILAARYRDFCAVLMGDAKGEAEEAVIRACAQGDVKVPVSILKVAHHGSRYASSERFLAVIRPVVSVISYGRGNMYKHPHSQLVERLEAVSEVIYGTGASGAASFRVR